MSKWLLAALFAATLEGAVLRGLVVDNQTGRPLARSTVVCQPVAGTPGNIQSQRTTVNGAFEFPSLAAGAYLVSVSRRSFAPLRYGQKRWQGAGRPIHLEESGEVSLRIRMQRYGAISGTVLDENDVGLAGHDIAVYRNTHPPQFVARGRTDDRGNYRFGGLEPGSYFVRTLAAQSDGASFLPTLPRQATRTQDALTAEASLDQQTTDVRVWPVPGRLFTIAGTIRPAPPAGVGLTLISEMGSEVTVADSNGEFKFSPAAPGDYEIAAQIPPDRRNGPQAVWLPIHVDRDRTDYRLTAGPLSEIAIAIEHPQGQPVDMQSVVLMARRRELSGAGKAEMLRALQGRAALAPGRWEFSLRPSPDRYVAAFQGPSSNPNSAGRPDGWNEVVLQGAGPLPLKFILAANPGSLHGTVTGSGNAAVAGAPVFLEAFDPERRIRLIEGVRMARTDIRGQYEFHGLAPGTYRLMSSFEYESLDLAAMDSAGPKLVKVEEGRDTAVDLPLFEIPQFEIPRFEI